jgi:ubiquinone/menaquinone biosynthesis C-methylase UbiE
MSKKDDLTENPATRIAWDKHMKYISGDDIKEKVILDVGCGNGRFTRFCGDFGAKWVCGLDISRRRILFGIKKKETLIYNYIIKRFPPSNVFFIEGNAQWLPFKNNSVDMIFCLLVFHHLSDKDAFLEECKRVLVGGVD